MRSERSVYVPIITACVMGVLCLISGAVAIAGGAATIPILVDSMRPGPGSRTTGRSLDGAAAERGNARWVTSGDLSFGDGSDLLRGSGPNTYAAIPFDAARYRRSALLSLEATLDPGDSGWAAAGFASTDFGPIQNVGELWFKLEHNGKVTVRARGSSIKLYQDAHPNPAFRAGSNRIRLEYDRRRNLAKAWLNGDELVLDPLDARGFVPNIRTVTFQLLGQGTGLKVGGGDPGIGVIVVGVSDATLGESFRTQASGLRQDGLPLNNAPIEYGSATWSARASVGFQGELNAGKASNITLEVPAVAGVPFDPLDYPGYGTSTVEAKVFPSQVEWVGVGFTTNPTGAFWNVSGQLWALVRASGRVAVWCRDPSTNGATAVVLFDQAVLTPEEAEVGVHLKVGYNRVTNDASLWVNDVPQTLTTSLNDVGAVPVITHAGFHAHPGAAFTSVGQFTIDNFAVRVQDEVAPLGFAESPHKQTVLDGGVAQFSCTPTGGVPPYSYQWQYYPFIVGGVVPMKAIRWSDVSDSDPHISGATTATLTVSDATEDQDGLYRCVVTDGNSLPATAESTGAALQVRETITGDRFTNDTSRRQPGQLLHGAPTEIGSATWAASAVSVFGSGVLTNSSTTAINAGFTIDPLAVETYKNLAVEAQVELGEALWTGVGFTSGPISGFGAGGQLWIQIRDSGAIRVLADNTSKVLFDQVLLTPAELEQPILVRIALDHTTNRATAWVNGQELALTATLDDLLFTPTLTAVSVVSKRPDGFSEPGVVAIDNFILSGYREVPAPSFDVNPVSQSSGLGMNVTLTCQASGGVAPLVYHWEWFSDGAWQPIPAGIHFSGIGTSSLSILDWEQALENSYKCVVQDSRLGEPAVKGSSSAWVGTLLPNFIMGVNDRDSTHIVRAKVSADPYRQVGILEVQEPYTLELSLGTGNPIGPGWPFPVTVWGECHDPGDQDTTTLHRLGSLEVIPNGVDAGGAYDVPITIPADCLGSSAWSLLTLKLDVNADDPDPSDDAYSDSISNAVPRIPENGFFDDNRGRLPSWAVVVVSADGSDDPADPDGGDELVDLPLSFKHTIPLERHFRSPADQPDPTKYPVDWTAAGGWTGTLDFQLANGIQDPDFTLKDDQDHDVFFQPYLVWDAQTTEDIELVLMRFNRPWGGSAGWTDFMYAGTTVGAPPSPDITDWRTLAQLGPYGSDSSNTVEGGVRQYQVVVWGGDDPSASNHFDGVSSIETPVIENGTDGSSRHVYIGYTHACIEVHGGCHSNFLEIYYADFVLALGRACDPSTDPHQCLPGTTDPDFSAVQILQLENDTIQALPQTLGRGETLRLCLETRVVPSTDDPPGDVTITVTDPNGDETTFETVVTGSLGGGETVHCAATGGWPTQWAPSDTGMHTITGVIADQDAVPANNTVERLVRVDSAGCPVPVVTLP